MAAPVRSASVASSAAVTSQTLTFTAPTAGNLLVTQIAADKDVGSDLTAPAGWTLIRQARVSNNSGAAAYKVATGSETSVTWSGWPTARGVAVGYAEYPLTNATLVASDVVSSNTAQKSYTSGPIATGTLALGFIGIDSASMFTLDRWTTTDPVFSGAARVFTQLGSSGNGDAAVSHAWADTTAGGTWSTTASWAGTGDECVLITAAFTTGGGTVEPGAGTTVNRVLGAVTSTSVTAVYKLANTTTARLAVATDAAFTNVVAHSASVTPDARGVARMTVTGLTADTDYWCRAESNGTLLTTHGGSFRTFRSSALTVGQSRSFAFSSCYDHDGSSGGVFDDMRARDPEFFLSLGDFPYFDYTSSDQGQFRTGWDQLLAVPTVNAAAAEIPFVYTWSDHDFGPDGSNASSATNAPANAVYREKWPHHSIPATTGIYQSFTWGPDVRVIVLDGRSFRTASTATDNSSKTMLGATQKQWLKDQISNATEPVVFIASEVGWIGGTQSGQDHWGMYQTERAELAAHFTATGKAGRVFMLCGDMHALAYDNGTNAAAGVRVLQAAPLGRDSNAGVKGGPYSSGAPIMGDWENGQFGLVTVARTASGYTVKFDGINQAGSTVITTTQAVTTGPAWSLWNGTAEQPLTVTVWNGTAEVAATTEVA